MNALIPVKLLIVDDLEENLLVLEALLRREGIELLMARSGREALELLLVHDVALALLDVNMPEVDGFELAELMRGAERTRRVPIIFVTAGAHDKAHAFRGYEVGAVDFLFKPIDPVLLNHKVTTFVELHRHGLERERLADELREMLRFNEMFVAAVSHDLRSPLSTISMGTQLLEANVHEPAGKRTLQRVRSSAERMHRMLDQLYDLARARLAGGISIEPRDMNLRPLADRVIGELKLAHPERTVETTYEPGSTMGVWDEQTLGQVLSNLVGNALRYGTPADPVTIRFHPSERSVSFSIHNGGEIPAEARSSLFDPFRRGARSREGLGLGLYIVRQIVLAHGGSIVFESSKRGGTTFEVTLPRVSSPDDKRSRGA